MGAPFRIPLFGSERGAGLRGSGRIDTLGALPCRQGNRPAADRGIDQRPKMAASDRGIDQRPNHEAIPCRTPREIVKHNIRQS